MKRTVKERERGGMGRCGAKKVKAGGVQNVLCKEFVGVCPRKKKKKKRTRRVEKDRREDGNGDGKEGGGHSGGTRTKTLKVGLKNKIFPEKRKEGPWGGKRG